MAIDNIAMGLACVMIVPALIFMATNKKVAMNAVTEAGLQKSVNDEALALAAYYLFLLGMMIFEFSLLTIGLFIGVSNPLAVCAGVSGAITILLTMAVTKQSITGIPGITGPPVPARVMLLIIGLGLNVNVIMHALDGDIESSEWVKFGAVYLVSVALPHAIAAKHRAEKWSAAPMM